MSRQNEMPILNHGSIVDKGKSVVALATPGVSACDCIFTR